MIHSFAPAVSLGGNFDDVSEATQDSDVFRGNQTATFYVAGFPGFTYPDGLVPGTMYYWRIDKFDAIATHKGDVWTFTTLGAVGNPQPAYGATNVGMNATLRWTPADI